MIEEILLDAVDKMEKSVAATKEDFSGIRTGRANAASFNRIEVDYYGARTPLLQLATISVPEPRMAVVAPFDKTQMGAVERAIRDSDLGVNPQTDGVVIRCVFPQLTEERRRDLVKVARAKAEDGRVSIRGVRRKAKEDLESLAREGDAGEDEVRRAEKELEDTTAQHVAQVDDALKAKESELLEV